MDSEIQSKGGAHDDGAVRSMKCSADSMMSTAHIRIYSRCPACHNDTLMINKGRLLCTWHKCSDPTLIDRLGDHAERPPDDYTYASKQATNCAVCGQRKHTPLRNDEMGGYVCLTCIDRELEKLQAANPQNDRTERPARTTHE